MTSTLSESTIQKMIDAAIAGQKRAYEPYSQYYVGASVLCASGKIYPGCNILNAAYPAGICAERVAAAKAISEGETIEAVCVVGEKQIYPCGICRQFIYEFAPTAPVILADIHQQYTLSNLTELLPHGFGRSSVQN